MKERPILFSAPMVRAILDGSKTQTRRLVKDLEGAEYNDFASWDRPAHVLDAARKHGRFGFSGKVYEDGSIGSPFSIPCPYGQPGDRLWVRETWQYYDWDEIGEPCIRFQADNATTWPIPSGEDWSVRLADIWASLSCAENYSIDNHSRDRRWRPSIHMPRWASRILLEIVSVRVERLQDISNQDARAEGVMPAYANECVELGHPFNAIPLFRTLWGQINGADSWSANPWVWVVEFKRVEA